MLSETKRLDLQRLAASSIGTKAMQRKPGLLIEQTQLIRELHLLQEHMVQLETEITSILEQSREGQIVQSFGIDPLQTATLLAAIGSSESFPNAGSLKSYGGWSPTEKQSGLTLHSTRQTRGGTRMMKQMMYLIVTGLMSRDTEWAKRDVRLVQAKCPVDPRTGERSGKVLRRDNLSSSTSPSPRGTPPSNVRSSKALLQKFESTDLSNKTKG
jgi:transposase